MTEKKSNVLKADENNDNEHIINPFQDEFDPASVVNKNVIDKEQAESSNIISESLEAKKDEEEIEELLSADEEEIKKNVFEPGIGTDEDIVDDEMEMKKNLFKDFLAVPKISGKTVGIPHSNLIPEEILKNRGKKIEINDDPIVDDDEHSRTTIMINKNAEGEIESIEVYCACGERTMIKLNYDNDEETEEE